MNTLKLGLPKKKEYAIDGDETRVIALDTSDVGIIARWHTFQAWANAANARVNELVKVDALETDEAKDEAVNAFTAEFAALDAEMREHINLLFDADVCTAIVGNGSVLRPVNGVALWEQIVDAIVPLYEKDILKEVEKSRARMEKHTKKYSK